MRFLTCCAVQVLRTLRRSGAVLRLAPDACESVRLVGLITGLGFQLGLENHSNAAA
jgi:hypothetical protein